MRWKVNSPSEFRRDKHLGAGERDRRMAPTMRVRRSAGRLPRRSARKVRDLQRGSGASVGRSPLDLRYHPAGSSAPAPLSRVDVPGSRTWSPPSGVRQPCSASFSHDARERPALPPKRSYRLTEEEAADDFGIAVACEAMKSGDDEAIASDARSAIDTLSYLRESLDADFDFDDTCGGDDTYPSVSRRKSAFRIRVREVRLSREGTPLRGGRTGSGRSLQASRDVAAATPDRRNGGIGPLWEKSPVSI